MRSWRGRIPSCMSRSRQLAAKWLTICSVLPVRIQWTSLWLRRENLKTKFWRFSGETCFSFPLLKDSWRCWWEWMFIGLWVTIHPVWSYLIGHHRFVRREKEIAESRFEVAQGETLRYRFRVEHLERELREVQDSLSAAKERMQVCFQKNWHYN